MNRKEYWRERRKSGVRNSRSRDGNGETPAQRSGSLSPAPRSSAYSRFRERRMAEVQNEFSEKDSSGSEFTEEQPTADFLGLDASVSPEEENRFRQTGITSKSSGLWRNHPVLMSFFVLIFAIFCLSTYVFSQAMAGYDPFQLTKLFPKQEGKSIPGSPETESRMPESTAPLPSASSPSSKPAKKEILTVHFRGVGDNLLHRTILLAGRDPKGNPDFSGCYRNIRPLIQEADFAYINQESIPGGDMHKFLTYPRFNCSSRIIPDLKNTGFDLVGQANNHTGDMGKEGILNAISYYEKYGLPCVGIHSRPEDRMTPYSTTVNGIRFTFFSVTYGLNIPSVHDQNPYLVDYLNDPLLPERLREARKYCDFLVVFPHWGDEYHAAISAEQRKYTELFAKCGVDLVVGTHPHVLQPFGLVKRPEGSLGTGDMLVYYSLGNFLSNQLKIDRVLEGMADLVFVKDGDHTYIRDYGLRLLVSHYDITVPNRGYYDDCRVIPYDEYDRDQKLRNRVQDYDQRPYPETLDLLAEKYKNSGSLSGGWVH